MRKFKIINPYAGVDWDSWHHYKTNLHTHSTASDAQVDFSDMIKAYYDAGFDILAMTDHGVVNHSWNQKPRRIPVLSVSSIIKKPTWLSDEEYGAILDGTYKNRGRGMTDLRYGIEINTAVFTKAHVNGFFTEYGQGLVGHENDFEGPVKGVAESGGLSVINHPGDWLESYVDVNHAHEKKNVELFADILKKYPSCLGIEAFNRIDTVTCADRILWDELLSAVIPSGRNVWGFANSDAHVLSDIDTSFMDFVLPDRTEQTARRGMENGTFFSIGRRAVYELGKDFVGEGEYPTVTRITVNEDEQSISIEGKNYNRVQWISNGKIIAE
ncbi:MAG: PHP domain-containing protein, partial [Acutalibacteraceae bacterium]|nr:PHP domain-containing protein [Acutalibacteraceae bacterium]